MDTISLLVEMEILKKKIDNAEAFLEELIHYIFVVCKDDDYITPEGICRKLYKYGFIDKKDREWVADTSQITLCRECDNYAGDGMYCASNYLVHDFSTSRENCEVDTPQINCDNCAENGSYKCTKCDGEMYYKADTL